MNPPLEVVDFVMHEKTPSDEEAASAFRTLLHWVGEDPSREGLKDTPQRAVRAWKEFFSGYNEDPRDHLATVFEEVDDFQGMVCLEGIRLESFCEHHLVPIVGEAFIAYYPHKKIVGISKLARVLEGYAKRMQIQENLTAQVAKAIDDVLEPHGVAVALRAEHSCLTTRGVHKAGSTLLTTTLLGCFKTDTEKRADFMALVNRA